MFKRNSSHFKKGCTPWIKGKTKEDFSQLANNGRKKGCIPWNKGKKGLQKMSEERKLQMSISKSGERNPSWMGGISFEPYSFRFNEKLKEKVRSRDSYRCQECFRHQDELYTKKGRRRKLSVHHIDYNKRNNDESNLVSLCTSCHMQTNFGREDWMRYFYKKGGE